MEWVHGGISYTTKLFPRLEEEEVSTTCEVTDGFLNGFASLVDRIHGMDDFNWAGLDVGRRRVFLLVKTSKCPK